MNESEAKARHVSYRLVTPFQCHTCCECRTAFRRREGSAKALIGTDDSYFWVFTAFRCRGEAEMMAVVQTAIIGGMPYATLRDRDLSPIRTAC